MRPRTLLLSGTVPGSGHVGEIILRDLSIHFGPQFIQCVSIVPEAYRGATDPGLDGMAFGLLHSAHTHGRARGPGKWASLQKRLRFLVGFRKEVRRIAEEVVAFVRPGQVQQVFAVLNNALVMAVAHRVARQLAVPLVVLVWDPPEYLFRQALFDRWSREALYREFRASLAAASRVAVVSETMQRDYSRLTSAPVQLLRHGIPAERNTSSPAPLSDEWLIGFAGSMYSDCAFRALVRALDQADWRVAGRPVRLRLLTERVELASRGRARIDYLGFRPPEDVQSILGQCHLTYMPQPFVPELADLCRYSFPTKLANYLALGRPVFVHCPADSALAGFVERHPVGLHSASLEAAPILGALTALLGDPVRYAEAGRVALEVSRSQFSDRNFQLSVDALLDPSPAGAA